MVAGPRELKGIGPDWDAVAPQWFIVSDLGLTAFSGNDGIHVFLHSLASADGKSGIELKLISRGNEVLAERRTDAYGHALFELGLAKGEGASAPALIGASDTQTWNEFLPISMPIAAIALLRF
jgi:alpha-2-macroglobulin